MHLEVALRDNVFFFNIIWYGKWVDKNLIRISMTANLGNHFSLLNPKRYAQSVYSNPKRK